MRLVSTEWLQQSLQLTTIARKSIGVNHHVLICGFGRCGQNLARVLESQNIPYMALDLDPERVRQASAAGHNVAFGDSARLQALSAAGLARASAVVVTYLDEPAVFKVLANTQGHAPQVPVIVRTQDDHNLEKLRAAGATEVVPEAIEGSLMLASHALALVGVPMRRVIRIVQDQRDARYNLLRGFFHGADDNSVDELQHERLATVTLPPRAKAVGQPLASFALEELAVRVQSLRRSDGKLHPVDSHSVLQECDTLVLSGRAEALALAEQRLLAGVSLQRAQSASSS
jgi:CPA2 family monovalent cation:H+ antiporter-2